MLSVSEGFTQPSLLQMYKIEQTKVFSAVFVVQRAENLNVEKPHPFFALLRKCAPHSHSGKARFCGAGSLVMVR